MKVCANVTALAKELGIRRKWLYAWKDEFAAPAPVESRADAKLKQLEALVARQSLELDFFKGALQRIEEQGRKREEPSGAGSTSK